MSTSEELVKEVALLKDAEATLQDRVLAIMRRHQAHEEGSRVVQPFVDAGGVAALADIITRNWPPGAAFENSDCPTDLVLLLTPDLDAKLCGWGPVSGQAARALRGKATVLYRSLRRVALDMLVDITEKATVTAVQELLDCGMFAACSFPLMISTSMERYVPGQTYTDQVEHPDQGQQIAQQLLWLAAVAATRNHTVARFMAQHCAVPVNAAFCDPWQVKWEPQRKLKVSAAATAAAAKVVASVKQRYTVSTSRVWPEAVPAGLSKADIKQRLTMLDHYGAFDKMTGAYAHFMNVVFKAASEEELLKMVEQGDASSKVIRCVGHPAVGALGSAQLPAVHEALMAAWDKKALQLSKEMAAARQAGAAARAAVLREEGNTCFKAGDYPAALKAYLAALAETSEDARLYLNISLTHLKMGNVNEAYDVARSGLAHDPTNSKAWVRLGDACSAAGRWQLAALCYKAAKMLGGAQDPDIETRHVQALQHLERAWDWDEIPPGWDVAGHASWLKLQAKPGGNMAAWLRKAEKEMSRLTLTSRSIATLHSCCCCCCCCCFCRLTLTSRSIATKLKAHMLTAQAMEAARDGRLARLPAMNEWQMSWGDVPMRAPVTGQIRYMIQVADCVASTDQDPALTPAPALLEGQPGVINCLQALATACFHPPNALPANKPSSLSLSYRMLSDYAALHAIFTGCWGIPVTMETKTDAQRAAVQYGTHYLGRNFEDVGYQREQLFNIASKMDDLHNDHKKVQPQSSGNQNKNGAGSSSAVQQKGSGSNSKKQQQRQELSGVGDSMGATSAATKHQRQFSSGPQGDDTAGGGAPPGKGIAQTIEHPRTQRQQQQQRVVTMRDAFEDMTFTVPGSTSSSSQPVRTVNFTLTGHCRMKHGEEWNSVVEAVRQGNTQAKDVKALQRLIDALR